MPPLPFFHLFPSSSSPGNTLTRASRCSSKGGFCLGTDPPLGAMRWQSFPQRSEEGRRRKTLQILRSQDLHPSPPLVRSSITSVKRGGGEECNLHPAGGCRHCNTVRARDVLAREVIESDTVNIHPTSSAKGLVRTCWTCESKTSGSTTTVDMRSIT